MAGNCVSVSLPGAGKDDVRVAVPGKIADCNLRRSTPAQLIVNEGNAAVVGEALVAHVRTGGVCHDHVRHAVAVEVPGGHSVATCTGAAKIGSRAEALFLEPAVEPILPIVSDHYDRAALLSCGCEAYR
jgi:hypothetical protein